MDELTIEEIQGIIHAADNMRKGKYDKTGEQVFVSNLFFENSTRTKTSFIVAEKKLGFDVVPFDVETSSVQKGETLYDTVRTLESVGVHAVVIRHSEDRYFEQLIGKVEIPIINGGDGTGNHPSQCMLDLYTIWQEFGGFNGLKVAIAGDIRHSRVAHSNGETLKRLGAEVYYACPEVWQDTNVEGDTYVHIDDIIEEVDVMMLLRVQHERHAEKADDVMDRYLENFGLTIEREKRMKKGSIIMHPAPVNRDVEIASELIECQRSRIFKQMENGVYARMAILNYSLDLK